LVRVAVLFFSATGTTPQLAEAVQAGAVEAAPDAVLCRIAPADIMAGQFTNEEVLRLADAADALAFGSLTYMGGPAA
jgi:NAD(P)H dehydrogenase (quinone)